MTGFVLFLALILLLGLALQPAHRRAVTPWRPGLDTRGDRDLARLEDDLQAASQREPEAAGSNSVAHLVAPRSAQTDARLITRTAA